MAEVSEDNKAVARITAVAFGSGDYKVVNYLDQRGQSGIDILHVADRPSDGLMSLATVGLSDYPLPGHRVEPPLGSELTGCSIHEEFANILSTAAFYVINNGWVPEPGRVFGDLVSIYFEDATTPHLYLVNPPWLWPDLQARELAHKTVGWLMAIPITEAERKYILTNGEESFENKLEDEDVDFIDLWRESIVD